MPAHYITRRPKLGPIDAQAVYPILLWMIHPRVWTAYILLVAILFLWMLARRGITISMMMRIFRRWIVGKRRQIRSPWRRPIAL
ncbi:IcmT/TraK family protein [Pseudomonas taiwanensis]|uniref:IcmT/TraK family protein n=1 Tax=Pseudomonas taiwanensis TaxID=470150 RepID=UPI0028DE3C3C|nr:IcmT/TraK family protein [Pseudomonas taiwanensis]MDT8925008.1 IcmT/TraK family protein [Pseudomonas taiwanensis]